MIKNCFLIVLCCSLLACDNNANTLNNARKAISEILSSTSNKPLEASAIEDYATARPMLWASVYANGGETLYCGERFGSSHPKSHSFRKGFNVEHVFPMSWASNGLNCGKRKQCRARSKVFNIIEADLHNLYPARADVNQDRSSFRFGNVGGESRRYGSHCDFEVDQRARIAEPAPEKRGEVARAMFYMADRYKGEGLILFKKQALLLEKWHRLDPPNDEEHRRNNVIEELQGNRNPFIDSPGKVHELVQLGHFFE
jgi:deoxyribonuclease-1